MPSAQYVGRTTPTLKVAINPRPAITLIACINICTLAFTPIRG